MIGGAAAFDFNNDGFLDIFFRMGDHPGLEKADPSYYNRLYRNNGDGTFTDVTEKAGSKASAIRWEWLRATTTTTALSTSTSVE